MARITGWQRMQKADADRTFVWWDFLRGEKHDRVKIRRAWYIAGVQGKRPGSKEEIISNKKPPRERGAEDSCTGITAHTIGA